MRGNNIPMNGPVILKEALKFADAFDAKIFKH